MYQVYPYILGLLDTLNDWDEKLKKITTGGENNVIFATIFVVGIFAVSAWAINFFNKK